MMKPLKETKKYETTITPEKLDTIQKVTIFFIPSYLYGMFIHDIRGNG